MPTRAFSGGWRMRLSLARGGCSFMGSESGCTDMLLQLCFANPTCCCSTSLRTIWISTPWHGERVCVCDSHAAKLIRPITSTTGWKTTCKLGQVHFLSSLTTELSWTLSQRTSFTSTASGWITTKATLRNSTPPSRSARSNRSANTNRNCSTGSICKHSSTDGDVSLCRFLCFAP